MYVNQWRFRSTKGLVHNADFYFNTGYLDANELVRQFVEVATSYEKIGVKLFGVVSDRGGGSTNFFCTLRDSLPMNLPWPNIVAIRCLNPVDPYRYAYTSYRVLHLVLKLYEIIYSAVLLEGLNHCKFLV